MTCNEFYGLDYSIKSFAVANDFVSTMNKGCNAFGKNLKSFCFYPNEEQRKFGVTDFNEFNGFIDSSKTLLKEIADFRREQYANQGCFLPDEDKIDKALLFDYLMTISICYIELPKYVTRENIVQQTYDKFLVTKNPAIMATWMGCQSYEMQIKYSSKVALTPINFIDGELKAVKLVSSAKGNSITCPRGVFNIENMSCMPLFMSYAFIKGLEPYLYSNILKFTYLKDNSTLRELPTTLSSDILMDYYKDQYFVSMMLQNVDIDRNVQGGLQLSSKVARGYIKVPELGISKYDSSGVRALNFNRVLSVEVVQEVDRTFIDVDLDSVVANFRDCLDAVFKNHPSALASLYKDLTGEEVDISKISTPLALVSELNIFVETREKILTTTFRRQLHMFMITRPQIFSSYTGKPNNNAVSSATFGVGTMDF